MHVIHLIWRFSFVTRGLRVPQVTNFIGKRAIYRSTRSHTISAPCHGVHRLFIRGTLRRTPAPFDSHRFKQSIRWISPWPYVRPLDDGSFQPPRFTISNVIPRRRGNKCRGFSRSPAAPIADITRDSWFYDWEFVRSSLKRVAGGENIGVAGGAALRRCIFEGNVWVSLESTASSGIRVTRRGYGDNFCYSLSTNSNIICKWCCPFSMKLIRKSIYLIWIQDKDVSFVLFFKIEIIKWKRWSSFEVLFKIMTKNNDLI